MATKTKAQITFIPKRKFGKVKKRHRLSRARYRQRWQVAIERIKIIGEF